MIGSPIVVFLAILTLSAALHCNTRNSFGEVSSLLLGNGEVNLHLALALVRIDKVNILIFAGNRKTVRAGHRLVLQHHLVY